MKKILVTGAILSLLSAQVFAQQSANSATSNAGNAAQASQAAGTAGAASSGGFLGTTALAGLSTGTLVAIGTAVAVVAVAASDNNSTTTHH